MAQLAIKNLSKLAPFLNTKDLLKNTKMLSVNQTMVQIKLTEMWKATNTNKNPLHLQPRSVSENERITRGVTNGEIENTGFLTLSKNSFIEDSKRVWNFPPSSTKGAKTIYSTKRR